jgi:drug/metabolite transporter (DMT)-like permease
MRVPNAALFVACSLIWGSTWLAITFQLGRVPPEMSVAYRFALAAALVALWCCASGRPLAFTAAQHAWLVALGATFFGFNYIAVYWAEQYVTSGLVAVAFSTIVFMSPIGMRVVYREPLTRRTLVAATLGVTGVGLLFLPELASAGRDSATAIGVVVALIATAIATVGNLVAVRNHKAGLPTLPATAWGMLYGALLAFVTSVVLGRPWAFDTAPSYLLSLAYLTVFGSVIAFASYLTLLSRVGATPSSFIGVATPVVAMLLSTLFEDYRWTWTGATGVVLALAGNWLALRKTR